MSWLVGKRPLRRVLVTRLRYLGDVVMASLVADVLKAGDPDLEAGFLCEEAHAPALAGHPSIDRIHLLGARRRGKDAAARGGAEQGGGRGTLALVGELRRARYDLAVDLFFNPRSAWLLYLSGIPMRIGGTTGSRRRLYTHALPRRLVEDPAGVLPQVAPGGLGEHLCRLAPLVHRESGQGFLAWLQDWSGGRALAPRLPAPPASAAALAALAAVGLDPDRPFLLLAPGATWPAKQWPAEHWAEAGRAAESACGLPAATLVPPGRGDGWRGLPRPLAPLPLADVLGLLARARAVVSVDGGVMHCAVAMGTPTLALFGPTDPGIWFPYEAATASRVLATRPDCHPCNRHDCPAAEFVCLPGLAPGKVVEALADMLERTAPRQGRR